MPKIKKKKKHNKVTPQISHDWNDKKITPISKNMRFCEKAYTSLLEEVLDKNISRIDITSNERIENYFKYKVYPKQYLMKIGIPHDKKIDFIKSMLQAWNETKQTYKNLKTYELRLYESLDSKNDKLHKRFKKAIPLKKKKKLNIFITLSIEESLVLTTDTIYADIIDVMFKKGKKKGKKNGRGTKTTYGCDDSHYVPGGTGPRWKPGPHLAAAKMPPIDMEGYGGTGLEILRSTHINQKEIIESRKHDKKPKGEYGNVAVIVQDNKSDNPVRELKSPRLSKILGVNGEYARVQVDKPKGGKPQRLYPGIACRNMRYVENNGTLSGKAGAGNDRKEGHTIRCEITVDLKEDGLNKKKKGGQRTTHRRASSVAACKKRGKRGKIRTISHPRRKK